VNAEPVPPNRFAEFAVVDVGKYLEKKGKYPYLSWAFALDQLLRRDPDAEWEYLKPEAFGETMMVYCAVTAFGKKRTAHLPVMNDTNKAIPNPDSFQVNKAMQRCLVKAIALHGLGLYVYAGEDLPSSDAAAGPDDEPPELNPELVLGFEQAEATADVAKLWNALPKQFRPDYRAIKDAALRRLTPVSEPAHA